MARHSHASARARLFVHLAKDQRHRGTVADRIAVCILGDNARIEKFVIKVVALTSTLTNTREHGGAAMALRDVVAEFLNEHGFAHASTTEQTDLAALCIKIGRASCRERVCQYVYISVVAGAFTKKRTITYILSEYNT